MKSDIGTFLRKVRRLAPRTKDLYGEHLDMFADWCKGRGITAWEDLTVDQVEEYLHEYRAGWAPATRWSAICAIRKFVRWRFGDAHPIAQITVERPESAPQRTLNPRQASQLLALFDTTTLKGVRDLAIASLMLDTGLRAAELVSAQMRHLDMDEGFLWAKIKGDLWEPAAFFEYTTVCLSRWLASRDLAANPGVTTIFVSVGGLTRGDPITRDGLRAIFRRFSVNSELGLISPHDLRRTFATLATLAGAPSRAVQVAGRWQHIQQVERYTRALRAKALQPWSPVNRLMEVDKRGFKDR